LPHEHGLWGPRLRPHAPQRSRELSDRLLDRLPDGLAITVQCTTHLVNGPVDGATLAPRRRRRLEWQRFKYRKAGYQRHSDLPLGGCATILSVIGKRARYRYQDDFRRLDALIPEIARSGARLEVVEVHCLDRVQHWWLDRPDAIRGFYRRIDAFLARLSDVLQERRVPLLLMSDHGMESVRNYLDLGGILAGSGLPRERYECFVETSKATFWAFDDEIGEQLQVLLRDAPDGKLLTRADLAARFGVAFTDNAYGDFFFYADPGISFFPNDFHHPLASRALAVLDWQQRPRLRDPRHRGEHGYIPGCEAEQGFALLVADDLRPCQPSGRLVDLAPSVLALLGLPAAAGMQGSGTLFEAQENHRQ
jgi:hypothetical protein